MSWTYALVPLSNETRFLSLHVLYLREWNVVLFGDTIINLIHNILAYVILPYFIKKELHHSFFVLPLVFLL